MPQCTFLIYNARLFGNSVVLPVRWALPMLWSYQDEARRDALVEALQNELADVVGLVEVWDARVAQDIVDALTAHYPHSHLVCGNRPLGMTNLGTGMLVLSRHPIAEPEFWPFARHFPDGWFTEKGVARLYITLPDKGGRVAVLLTHTNAGLLERDRRNRAADMHEVAKVAAREDVAVVMGDFNTTMAEQDVYAELQVQDCWLERARDGGFTFDSERNSLARRFYPTLRWWPRRERYDRILYRGVGVRAVWAEVEHTDRYRFGDDCPCSDHYPVRARLAFGGDKQE